MGWVMNERGLFTRAEWEAMTDAEREQWRELRRLAVEHAQREHTARQSLNDALTVERFGTHEHG